MHGQYVCNLHDNNSAHSFEWLIRSDLKIETKSLIFAAQDQTLNTKYYNSHILGGTDSSCRLCSCGNQTVAYIVSGCSSLAGTSYKKRHDVVGHQLHWCLCSLYGFSTVKEWWRHNPRPVEDSDRIKLLWDFTIITDRTICAK